MKQLLVLTSILCLILFSGNVYSSNTFDDTKEKIESLEIAKEIKNSSLQSMIDDEIIAQGYAGDSEMMFLVEDTYFKNPYSRNNEYGLIEFVVKNEGEVILRYPFAKLLEGGIVYIYGSVMTKPLEKKHLNLLFNLLFNAEIRLIRDLNLDAKLIDLTSVNLIEKNIPNKLEKLILSLLFKGGEARDLMITDISFVVAIGNNLGISIICKDQDYRERRVHFCFAKINEKNNIDEENVIYFDYCGFFMKNLDREMKAWLFAYINSKGLLTQ